MRKLIVKVKKGLVAITHPFKYFRLSNKLLVELNVTKQNLEAERALISKLQKDLAIERTNSIFYIFPKLPLGKDFSRHDKSKKQVLVLGYYGATNYGDELMLKTVLDNVDNTAEYSVLFSPNCRYNFSQWQNCIAYYHPDSIDDFIKIAEFYDEIIIGGGAHLDDNGCKDLGFIPFLGLELSLLFIKLKKTVRWIGVSSNKDFCSIEYVNKLKQVVDGSTEFSVRDTFTLNLLISKYNFDKNKIKLVDDLAFGVKNKKIIGVTLIDFLNNKKQNVALVEEIIRFVKENGNNYRLCFISFFNEFHHDTKMYSELAKEINFDGVDYFISPEYQNVESMYLMIAGCDLLINMRYHATLLSLSYRKPTVAICYDIHPHYYNKMTYINEKFNNPYILSYSNYQSGQLLKTLNKMLKIDD